MRARLSIVASAPFVRFAFITHLHVHTDATYLNIRITFAYTGTLYVCHAENAFSAALAMQSEVAWLCVR